MRQKELRIALVCYGGVSLAVYMHGVTKEVWHLARASRDFHGGASSTGKVGAVYRDLIEYIEERHKVRLRVLPDILTGASAGGINAVFLAQAIHSGHDLEPLTELWLSNADVERLLDPDARPWSRIAKLWAMPLVWWLLRRPGNAVSESVAPEARAEVRRKVSHLVRGRWFEPPFSGYGYAGQDSSDGFFGLAAFLFPQKIGIGQIQLLGKFASNTYDVPGQDVDLDTLELNVNYVIKAFNARLSLFYIDSDYKHGAAADSTQVGLGLQVQI